MTLNLHVAMSWFHSLPRRVKQESPISQDHATLHQSLIAWDALHSNNIIFETYVYEHVQGWMDILWYLVLRVDTLFVQCNSEGLC
jgi:hypothetical protein